MTADTLSIPESILLLALRDDTGEKRGSFTEYALAGAALTELVLQKRLTEKGKKLEIASTAATSDAFLDGCLAAIADKGSGKDAKSYVQHIGGKKPLLAPLYEGLVQRGILSEQTVKVLWVFDRTVWPERNPKPERELEARLRMAIAGSGSVEPRDGAIIAIALHADILRHNFDQDLLKQHKDRIRKIAAGDLLPPNATKDVIEATKTAVMVAAIMPAIIVATN